MLQGNGVATAESPLQTRKSWRISVAVVAFLGIFIVGFDLNGYRTLTQHEGFVAVVSREMLQTGDWVVPRFGGLPRLKKPPLAYWCAAATSWALGEHAPWTARLPFAISGSALAGLVGVWAGQWYGRWCGLSAALVQLTSVHFISFSRKAEVDMLLCLLTTSALFLVANASKDENRKQRALRWIGIYTLVGLAWLAKFHFGPAMVLGVIFAWHVADRRRPALWDVFSPIGLGILAAAVLIWPWLLLQKVPEAWTIWQTETIGRAFGELGREPVWFYVPQIVLQALPWSFLLWKAGQDSFHEAWKEGDRQERFLWVWFLTQLAILTASAFKHHHYLMAAMPALSLILGRTLHCVCSDLRKGTIPVSKKHTLGLIGSFGLIGGTVAVGVSLHWPHLRAAAIVLGVVIAAAGLVLAGCVAKRRWTPAVVALGIGFVACYAILTAVIFPNRDRRLPYVEFAKNAREAVPSDEIIILYGLKEDPLAYYLEGPLCRAESVTDLARLLERGPSVVVTDQAHLPDVTSSGYELHAVTLPQSPTSDPVPVVLVKCTRQRVASSLMGN